MDGDLTPVARKSELSWIEGWLMVWWEYMNRASFHLSRGAFRTVPKMDASFQMGLPPAMVVCARAE